MMALDRTLSALADPTRRRTLELLRERPRRPTEIAGQLAITPAALSRHLRVLRRAELVHDERDPDDSRVRIYSVRHERLGVVQQWLTAFWSDQLDAFAAHVEGS